MTSLIINLVQEGVVLAYNVYYAHYPCQSLSDITAQHSLCHAQISTFSFSQQKQNYNQHEVLY